MRVGKKVISICSHCGTVLKTARMDIVPKEEKIKNNLDRIIFDAFINSNLEKNLILEPAIHFSKKIVWKKLYKEEQVECNNCKNKMQSALSLKFMDIVVLLCM